MASQPSDQRVILGIESSCDESAASIVMGTPGNAQILSHSLQSQEKLHARFGGVVPEIAARAHAECLDYLIEQALRDAGMQFSDCHALAVTSGPGLIGGLLAGVMMAKGIAAASGLPLIGINHLAGHALTPRLTNHLDFPYLMLLVSGGHCQALAVSAHDRFELLGTTIDDAPGEVFDKAARALGLSQPGGPAIEAIASNGNLDRFHFPRPMIGREGADMSFSGLKTALLRARDKLIAEQGGLRPQDQADLAAGLQTAIAETLASRMKAAIRMAKTQGIKSKALAIAGGVGANQAVRKALIDAAQQADLEFLAPPLELCTDNAAMIAYAGLEAYSAGNRGNAPVIARPRWPLDEAASGRLGGGRKGPKA